MRNVISLLDHDPDLGEDLDGQQAEIARRELVVDVIHYPVGRWDVGPDDFNRVGSLGLLVIDGLLARQVTVGSYTCAELLGPGDVLQPWLRVGPNDSVASEIDWEAAEPLSVAVLGREFTLRAGRWPEVTAAVARRLMQRAHWLAFHLAVCGLRRVDDRLLLVLWHFADRWGAVTPQGVRIDVRLTHDLLAAVVGARRPSVTTALRRLADEGHVVPQSKSRWLLLGSPPAEFQQVQEKTRPTSATTEGSPSAGEQLAEPV